MEVIATLGYILECKRKKICGSTDGFPLVDCISLEMMFQHAFVNGMKCSIIAWFLKLLLWNEIESSRQLDFKMVDIFNFVIIDV